MFLKKNEKNKKRGCFSSYYGAEREKSTAYHVCMYINIYPSSRHHINATKFTKPKDKKKEKRRIEYFSSWKAGPKLKKKEGRAAEFWVESEMKGIRWSIKLSIHKPFFIFCTNDCMCLACLFLHNKISSILILSWLLLEKKTMIIMMTVKWNAFL